MKVSDFVPGRKTRAILSAIQTDLIEVKKELKTMGDVVVNAAAAIEANFKLAQAALTSITAGVLALDKKITDLEAQIAASGTTLTPEAQAALDQLVTDSTTLATQAQGISTAPPA